MVAEVRRNEAEGTVDVGEAKEIIKEAGGKGRAGAVGAEEGSLGRGDGEGVIEANEEEADAFEAIRDGPGEGGGGIRI